MDDYSDSGLEELDQWLSQFLEDPYAVFADAIRTDVFETSSSYFVEADLRECPPAEMMIMKDDCCLLIETAGRKAQVFLPFSLKKRKIDAVYTNQVLEIIISKNEIETDTKDTLPLFISPEAV